MTWFTVYIVINASNRNHNKEYQRAEAINLIG